MSDIVIEARDDRLSLSLYPNAESGVYAGVAVKRVAFASSISEARLNSMTSRAVFRTSKEPTKSFDVDLLILRKISNVHNSETESSMTYAYYFEVHVHKKSSALAQISFVFTNGFFPDAVTTRYMIADPLANTSFVSHDINLTSVQLFEVDPASKARQIFDSV